MKDHNKIVSANRLIVCAEGASVAHLQELLKAHYSPVKLLFYDDKQLVPDLAQKFPTRDDQILAINMFPNLLNLCKFLISAPSADVLYIRPRVFRYYDGVAALTYPHTRDDALHKILRRCDEILAKKNVLELESLFHGGILAALSAWFGVSLAADTDSESKRIKFDRAMTSITNSLGGRIPVSDLHLESQVKHNVGKHELTPHILVVGWCEPEERFVWSWGLTSKIRLHIGGNNTPIILKLTGFRVRGDVQIQVRLNGVAVKYLLAEDLQHVELTVKICEELLLGDFLDVDLIYNKAISPHEIDPQNGDLRPLAFALQHLQYWPVEETSRQWTPDNIRLVDEKEHFFLFVEGSGDANWGKLARDNKRVVVENADAGGHPLRAETFPSIKVLLQHAATCLSRLHISVGKLSIEEFVNAAAENQGINGRSVIVFSTDEADVSETLLRFLSLNNYLTILSKSRVTAFPEALAR